MKTLFLLSVLIFAFSCQKQTETNQPVPISQASPTKEQARDINVVLRFNVEGKDSRQIKILGTTNLPDKTKLLATIEGKDIKYKGETSTIVSDGKFETEEFGFDNQQLPLGIYAADVVMPISSTQEKEVQEIIGKEGENLKGDLVKTNYLGSSVKVTQEFQLK